MNNVSLVGRLTRDPELRTSRNGGVSVTKFSVAVDRRFKRDGEQSADFINIVSFGKTAEFVANYFIKGQRIGLTGRIQTGNYTNKDGFKVYTTDVVAEQVEFVESKKDRYEPGPPPTDDNDGFIDIPDELDGELPFL